MDIALQNKYEHLRGTVQSLGRMALGFSGGVDSTLLLKVAVDTVGAGNVLAVIGRSDTYPEREYAEAIRLAASIGATVREVETRETDVLKFQENPPDRCYYCKTELFSELRAIADAEGIAWIVDGTHADDTGDFRPGMRAVREAGVRSPLLEAGMGKRDIRAVSAALGLPTADKPSFACLSSRFPYGMKIDPARLRAIDRAESLLYDLGCRTVRVRQHDENTARIEVGVDELAILIAPEVRSRVIQELRDLGFTYITLDLEGFRSGSMNNLLSIDLRNAYVAGEARPTTG
jgi:uncharacterized protein